MNTNVLTTAAGLISAYDKYLYELCKCFLVVCAFVSVVVFPKPLISYPSKAYVV